MSYFKYLSIITNFGCHYQCPECITKSAGIGVPRTTIEGLDSLESVLKRYGCNIVSVSGGGDPLYEYEKNYEWYRALLKKLGRAKIPLEMHTSYTTDDTSFPFYDCCRVVYHLHTVSDLDLIRRTGNEIVRAVFVVTPDFTKEKIIDIAGYVENSKEIDELSFREYVDEHFTLQPVLSDFLQTWHKKLWYYISQCDYNLYYAENEVHDKFSDFLR